MANSEDLRSHLLTGHGTYTQADDQEMRAMHDEYHDNIDRQRGVGAPTHTHERTDLEGVA